MKTRLFLPICLILFTQIAPAKLDVSKIKWDDIKTKVRWLNFYEKNTLITLVVDEVPALKRVGAVGYYAPTQFPPGSYPCELVDAVSKEKMTDLSISTNGDNQYCLVTFGSEKAKIQSVFFEENLKVKKPKESTLTIYNMLPDGELQWQLPDFPVESIASGKAKQISFASATGIRMDVPARTITGSKNMKLEVAADPSDGNWIAFCHYGGASGKDLEMSYIKQGTSIFILGGARAHEQ